MGCSIGLSSIQNWIKIYSDITVSEVANRIVIQITFKEVELQWNKLKCN